MKILVIVDMQNDFISGGLGSDMAKAIVPNIVKKIGTVDKDTLILFTQDTHFENYLETQEGKNLPVVHCIDGTDGWKIESSIENAWYKYCVLNDVYDEDYEKDIGVASIFKETFASLQLAESIQRNTDDIESIELCGTCTEICVVSNAMLLKSAFPETLITVDASCCAGVTKQAHNDALNVMQSCQINVINRED